MSIHATLWRLKFPADGDSGLDDDWVRITAQAVPAHIGPAAPGEEDPFPFLPPPVPDPEDEARLRAVVFVREGTRKGTTRSGQEYDHPLLVLPGEEYARIRFEDLHRRLSGRPRQPTAEDRRTVPRTATEMGHEGEPTPSGSGATRPLDDMVDLVH